LEQSKPEDDTSIHEYWRANSKKFPVIYEIWRKLNGFPPDFYIKNGEEKKG
jgi:hypothetical protein